LGMEDAWIEIRKSEYSSHVERVHGKLHASFFRSHPPAGGRDGIWCIIYDKKFNKRNGLIRHYRETHAKKEKLFDKPYQCPEYGRGRGRDSDGDNGEKVEEGQTRNERALVYGGVEAWIKHVREFHGESVI
jgi:hypothetical protein